MPIEIRSITVAEVEQSGAMTKLLAQYASESSSPEFGKVEACFPMYHAMETSGSLHIIGAFSPDLVGLAVLIVYGLPHYGGYRVCAMESFFVLPEARETGAGLKLLRAAESKACDLDARALMVSAPAGGRLQEVLPRQGYRHSSSIFVRALP